jgi:hypothetical protein
MATIFESGSAGITLANNPLSAILKPGIGSGDDLAVKIKKTADGKWYPMIHKGWYYYGAEERYLFAKKQTHTVTTSNPYEYTTSYIIGETIDTSAITHYGPIFCTGPAGENLTRVCGSMTILASGTWTSGSGSLWSTVVPGNIEQVISTKYDSLYEVPDAALVTTDRNFYFDSATLTLYIAAYTDPTTAIVFTYTRTPTGSEILNQQEMVVVDRNNKIRLRYQDIENRDPLRLPAVSKMTTSGLYRVEVTSGAVSGNVILLNSNFAPRDIVGVGYVVKNSFGITTRDVHTYTDSATSYTLSFEDSMDNYQDLSEVLTSDLSYIQLNPMYSGIENGFLYLAPTISPYNEAANLYLAISPTRVTIISGDACPVRIKATITDKDNNPVAGVQLIASITGAGEITHSFPDPFITNYLGEVTFSWRPSGAGAIAATITASTLPALTKTATALGVSVKDIMYTSASFTPKVLLMAESIEGSTERIKLKACITRADGVIATNPGIRIRFISRNNSLQELEARTDRNGIASLTCNATGQDTIRASIYDNWAGSVIFSNEVSIGI